MKIAKAISTISILAMALSTSAFAIDGKMRFSALPDGTIHMKAALTHPMENGYAKDKDGKAIPAKFISSVRVLVDGQPVAEMLWSGGVTKNPFFSLALPTAKKGSTVRLELLENTGAADSLEAKVE